MASQDDIELEVVPPTHVVDDVEWQICCSHSSKSFVKYMVTVAMSIIVLVFSIFMIGTNSEKDNSIYFSLLSSIITLYIPPPSLLDKSE